MSQNNSTKLYLLTFIFIAFLCGLCNGSWMEEQKPGLAGLAYEANSSRDIEEMILLPGSTFIINGESDYLPQTNFIFDIRTARLKGIYDKLPIWYFSILPAAWIAA